MAETLNRILKALADENRMRILNVLADKPLCVCEIESALSITQSNASRHLKVLKDAGLITTARRAQFIEHALNHPVVQAHGFISHLMHEYQSTAQAQRDKDSLARALAGGITRCQI